MKRALHILTIALFGVALSCPNVEANDRGNNAGSPTTQSRSNTGRTTNGGQRNSNGNSSRPNSNPNSSRPAQGVNNSRPNNSGTSTGVRPGSNPGKPSQGNVPSQATKPGNGPSHNPGGNHGNNFGPGGNPGGNHGNNFGPGGNPGGNRPGAPGPNPGHGHNYGYGPGHNPGPGPRPGHSHVPNYAPQRPLLPPVSPFYRPTPPPSFRPGPRYPIINTILGITIGTAINATLDYLLTDGYYVTGYTNDAVYLNDVMQLNLMWPNATLYYNRGRLSASEFVYSTPYYDPNRYYVVYNSLTSAYGMPVTRTNLANGGMTCQWFGYDGRFVTLRFSPEIAYNGTTRYYTTLSFGI